MSQDMSHSDLILEHEHVQFIKQSALKLSLYEYNIYCYTVYIYKRYIFIYLYSLDNNFIQSICAVASHREGFGPHLQIGHVTYTVLV